MGQKKGKKLPWLKEHQFTSTKQPTPEQKKKALMTRKENLIFKRLAKEVIQGLPMKEVAKLAKDMGLNFHAGEYTWHLAITLRQIQKAWEEGDTKAYVAIMDRMFGKPIQQTVNQHEFDTSNRKGLKWDQEEE